MNRSRPARVTAGVRSLPAVLVLLALTGCAAEPDRVATAPGSAAPASQVVRDGDRVTASGRVVQVPGSEPRFCAPESIAGVGYAPGQEPPPQRCALGVDLVGVDLATLAERREKQGAVEGRATLTGTYDDGVLTVEQQSPPPPPQTVGPPFEAQDPPCPDPEGGWPRDASILRGPGYEPEGDANMEAERPALDAHRAAHPEQYVDIALLRPFPDSVLLGVITPDEAARAAVEEALRPAYGERLCVVVSRFTTEQLAAAARDVGVDVERGIYAGTERHLGDDLQLSVRYDVVMVTEELQAAVDRHPDGMVVLDPWLVPA